MSEEEKIEESREDGKTESPEEQSEVESSEAGGETVATSESEISNSRSEIKTMEVHHHPQVEKKSFKEYILEGLMIFLAVTMGFFAENIRESITEGHREKQFMESMINDLRLDSAYASRCIEIIDSRISAIDSTVNYFMIHQNVSSVPYNMVRKMKRSTWDRVFIEHTGTIDQLKYSGGLRLIQNRQIVDSIESYYQQIIRFEGIGHLIYLNGQDRIHQLSEKLFDFSTEEKYEKSMQDTTSIGIVGIHTSFLNEYLNHLLQLKSSANNDKKNDAAVIVKVENLMALIQKEYHLEHEEKE
ncbi:MAG: hypothetical protein KGL19_00240 [Bacteroidota bacterium]|nr:hypothetical protein [Bacteroidota bacterium]